MEPIDGVPPPSGAAFAPNGGNVQPRSIDKRKSSSAALLGGMSNMGKHLMGLHTRISSTVDGHVAEVSKWLQGADAAGAANGAGGGSVRPTRHAGSVWWCALAEPALRGAVGAAVAGGCSSSSSSSSSVAIHNADKVYLKLMYTYTMAVGGHGLLLGDPRIDVETAESTLVRNDSGSDFSLGGGRNIRIKQSGFREYFKLERSRRRAPSHHMFDAMGLEGLFFICFVCSILLSFVCILFFCLLISILLFDAIRRARRRRRGRRGCGRERRPESRERCPAVERGEQPRDGDASRPRIHRRRSSTRAERCETTRRYDPRTFDC